MYKGKHYNRALLKERTRILGERYLAPPDYGNVGGFLEPEHFRKPHHRNGRDTPIDEAVSYNLLMTYLNYLLNAKTDEERNSYWRQARFYAARLGLHDYRMSVFAKHPIRAAAEKHLL